MDHTTRTQTLREFGLGPYAGRAYLALLELGPTDARSVSQAARVPPAKIYATLAGLLEKGLVRLVLDRPRRYEPIPFADYVAQQRAAHLETASRLERRAPEIAALFDVRARRPSTDRGSFEIIRGRATVLQRHRQLVEGARAELLVRLSDGAIERMGNTRELLAIARANGVRSRVLTCAKTRAADGMRVLTDIADVRILDARHALQREVGYAIVDRAQALVTHFVPDDIETQAGHDVAVHITERAIVESLADMIDALWRASKPASAGRPRARRA